MDIQAIYSKTTLNNNIYLLPAIDEGLVVPENISGPHLVNVYLVRIVFKMS